MTNSKVSYLQFPISVYRLLYVLVQAFNRAGLGGHRVCTITVSVNAMHEINIDKVRPNRDSEMSLDKLWASTINYQIA